MKILLRILARLGFAALLFIAANHYYSRHQYAQDVRKYSRVKNRIDSAFRFGDIVYLGESSNTSFNPWTDTLAYSISEFLQMYLPGQKIEAVTHEGYHPGLFRQMLNLWPEDNKKRTLIVTLNMRTCGPSALYSSNEASNQQEALFYSRRPPLLTRMYLSLHHYDNRNANEMERLKLQGWRTESLRKQQSGFPWATVRDWYDQNPYSQAGAPEKIRHMADAYIKEFAFLLDDKNPRIKDLDEIAAFCKKKNIRLIYHLLPENRDYAKQLFGPYLISFMDANALFIASRYQKMGVELINNYPGLSGLNYTDQWYPTEHFNATIRQQIALSIAEKINAKEVHRVIHPARNNSPNPHILQPMADTLLKEWREKVKLPW
ncbi:MAG: hypothetical protein JNL57_04330 [Bacteroidetes bacterium]|nr:hypothetical protein [Bacteroidota bacterium]